MGRYAEWMLRHRWGFGVLLLVVTALAGWGASRLTLEDVPRKFLSAETPEWRGLEELFEQFGSDDGDCVILLESGAPTGWFDPERAGVLRGLVRALHAQDGVDQVLSLADVPVFVDGRLQSLLPAPSASAEQFAAAGARARQHPIVGGRLLSLDGRALLILATIRPDRTAIAQLTPVVDHIRSAVATAVAGQPITAHVSGVPALRSDIFNALHREQAFFATLGAILASAVALLLFRRPAPVLITAGASLVGSLWAVGVIGALGIPLDILSIQLPTLVMVIAFTDAVHLMVHIRTARARGEEAAATVIDAVRRLGPACALTSFTTAVGFGSLASSGLPVLQRYGLVCAAGVGVGLVAMLAVLPWCCTWAPLGAAPAGRSAGRRWTHRWADALGAFAVRRRWWVGGGGCLLAAALMVPALSLEPDNSITESLPEGTASFEALHAAEEVFGGVMPAFVVVEWEGDLATRWADVARVLDGASRAIESSPFPSRPISVLDLLSVHPLAGGDWRRAHPGLLASLPPEALAHLLHLPTRRALVRFQVKDEPSAVQLPQIAALERALAAIAADVPGVRCWLTGTSVVARRNVNDMIRALATGLGVAAVIIFGVITLAFRSVWFGLISLPVNALPLLAAGALVALRGEPLQLTSAVAFTVCLGIAVDDTIHLLTRYRHELAVDGDRHAAIQRAVTAVGGALAITTVTLGAGFGILGTSAMPVMRTFAWLSCTGFVVALACDLLLLPALLAILPVPGGRSAK